MTPLDPVSLARAAGAAEEAIREAAVAELEALGPPPTEALPELVRLLAAPEADVAYWAATLLGRLGAAGRAAAPALAEALRQRDEPAVRERAAWALGRLGDGPTEAFPTVVAALREAAQAEAPRLSRLAREALAAKGFPSP